MPSLYRWLYPRIPLSETSEFQALVLTSQRVMGEDQTAVVREFFNSDFDWDRFIDLTLEHKVHMLVYWNLNQTFRELVPEEKFQILQDNFSETVMANLSAKGELGRILAAYQQADIRAMPIRGLSLAYLLYGGLWLREFKDIDLLVEESKFSEAEQILLDLGYIRTMEIEDNAYNQKLFNIDLQIEVELHWALDAPFVPVAATSDYYWAKATKVSLEEMQVEGLPFDDLLVTLSFHGVKHRWSRLKWLCDINELTRLFSGEDWNIVLEEAKKLHVERIVLVNLWLVQSLFQTALPDSVSIAFKRDPLVEVLGSYGRHWLSAQEDITKIDQVRGMSFFVLIRENSSERIPAITHGLRYPKSQIARSIAKWLPFRVLRSVMFRGEETRPH